MSYGPKTENLASCQSLASVLQPELCLKRNHTMAAVQVIVTNECVCAATIPACCVTPACNSFTEASHGYETGLVGQFTTSLADLPCGLSPSTNYYVIDVDDCTFKVASTRADAIAGTAVAIADAGTGTHTFTPTTVDACTPANNGTITFHASVDSETFATANLDCVSIGLDSAGSNTVTTFTQTPYNKIQVDTDVLIGQWTISIIGSAKD